MRVFRTYLLPNSEFTCKGRFVHARLISTLSNHILLIQKQSHMQVYRSYFSDKFMSAKLRDVEGGSSSTHLNSIPPSIESDDSSMTSATTVMSTDSVNESSDEDTELDVGGEGGEVLTRKMGRRLRRKTGGKKVVSSAEFNRAVRQQDFETAIRIFDEICLKVPMSDRNMNLYMSAISVCYKSEHLERAQQILQEMESLFANPNISCHESFNLPIIRCLCDRGDTGNTLFRTSIHI